MAKILIIEDNETNLELMVYLLKAFGHEPSEAMTGEDGIEALNQELPDLILCDLQLPGMDGYEVANILKNRPSLAQIPLVAVTAFAMVGDQEKVLNAGFNGYIAKPIAPDLFVGQVEKFLLFKSIPFKPHTFDNNVESTPVPSKHKSILLVDDMAINLEVLKSVLNLSGYDVVPARSVEQALTLAHQTPPDLVLTDLIMPGQDGFDLLQAVKSDPGLAHIPVVVHSASSPSLVDRQRAINLGASNFIIRPIETDKFLLEIEKSLD